MSVIIDKTRLSDSGCDFIDEPRLLELLERKASPGELHDTIAKSMAKQPLSLEETAVLLAADDPASVEQIFAAARQLKRDVYGNRIVLFAPLYIGNECTNDCQYCGFRRSNRAEIRRTLEEAEIRARSRPWSNAATSGPSLSSASIRDTPRSTWPTACGRSIRCRLGTGQIRRVNINAAPLDHAGYATVKAAHIGTYQIFQETYHHETYNRVHPRTTSKGNYLWRLDGVARAMEAQCDDVGIGALFGLYDWRFEVLAPGRPRLALAEALQRRAAHDQLPPAPPGKRSAVGRKMARRRRRVQAAGGGPAAGRARTPA